MPAPKGHKPYPGCEMGGRPKTYTDNTVNQIADKLDAWIDADPNNIFVERFCLSNRLPSRKVSEWYKCNEKFRETYDRLLDKQRVCLFEGGLKRKYAHPMCALVLSNNHGIYQKNEQKISGDVSNTLACIINDIDGRTKDLVR